jgi:hypothetical protein
MAIAVKALQRAEQCQIQYFSKEWKHTVLGSVLLFEGEDGMAFVV